MVHWSALYPFKLVKPILFEISLEILKFISFLLGNFLFCLEIGFKNLLLLNAGFPHFLMLLALIYDQESLWLFSN
jgi:hypothetical protein